MKKCLILILAALLLTGCSAEETMETVSDVYIQPVMGTMQQAVVSLPVDASVSVLENEDTGTIYLCDGYTVTLNSLPGGNLEQTLRQTTGFGKEDLSLMQTESDGIKRIHGVWTAAGETEQQIGRVMVLDDGSYHYVLTCMADASRMKELQPVWQDLFDSFRLVSPDYEINTGS